MALLDNQWDKKQPICNIISISNKKENGLLDCPFQYLKKKKKITFHTEVSALEKSRVEYIPLADSTAQHSKCWH